MTTADDALSVFLPVDLPQLSARAARMLLEILIDAVENFDGKSASTTTMTPTPLSQEVTKG